VCVGGVTRNCGGIGWFTHISQTLPVGKRLLSEEMVDSTRPQRPHLGRYPLEISAPVVRDSEHVHVFGQASDASILADRGVLHALASDGWPVDAECCSPDPASSISV
jgi:hypothetical protein